MPPLACHVMCRLADGRVIAPTPEARRIAAGAVLEKASERQLLAFSLPDTHLHLELFEDGRTSAEVARRVEITVTKRLGLPVGFAPAHIKEILDQRHLFNVFDYIMRQGRHHGLESSDPLHEGSNLPDLLGLRVAGAYTANNVRKRLPRVNRLLLLSYLHVDELEARSEPIELIVPSVLAAAGLAELGERTEAGRRARRAVVEVIGDRLPATRIASLLGTDRRTVHRLRALPPDQALVRAVQLQLGLRRLMELPGERGCLPPRAPV